MTVLFFKERYEDLDAELVEIRCKATDPVNRVTRCHSVIRVALDELMVKLESVVPIPEEEEMVLNRVWLVKFYALFIYETEVFRLVDCCPKSVRSERRFYKVTLKVMGDYLSQHAFLYEYYFRGMVGLDALLFIKGRKVDHLFLPESPEFFGGAMPPCTYIFARFMAYDQLILELRLKLDPGPIGELAKTYTHGLKWTGNKVNVAELAYGLYYAGQFNNGNAEVTDIYKWLEESLGISMGSVHRKFIDLRRRNTASPTKLLDKMREAIHQRIDEDLQYKPNRGIKLSKSFNED
ncbi:MAG: RteC domain-containing protein [Candidatus Pedobacter colombiensis]|uniref:RteC domain-containing protein n=1 Tax=Candidatus Pedobacter colombiensis TaxID=3121371 RepID=A0AAJ5WD00_9SPHI|nr:RteC domain-containing protein [Pedobacter sp.]WEK20427.1 MAG: RteC domain-containing protein [Pedobacter sp.]